MSFDGDGQRHAGESPPERPSVLEAAMWNQGPPDVSINKGVAELAK
jgi:hypothetical protein